LAQFALCDVIRNWCEPDKKNDDEAGPEKNNCVRALCGHS
jgi:hypothetical protein